MRQVILGHLCFVLGQLSGQWYWWAIGCTWVVAGGIIIWRDREQES